MALSAIVVSSLLFVSCKSDTPKAAAEKFLNGFYHFDYDAAKSVSTKETKQTLDLMSQLTAMYPDSAKAEAKKIKITIKDEKIEGDKATVTYTSSDDGNKMERKLNLVKGGDDEKENKGKWLVAWSKDDSMGGGNESDVIEPAPTENEMDTTVAPPADEMADSNSSK